MGLDHGAGKHGVCQGDGPRCGAACALQLLKLLGCAKSKDTVGYVMSRTKTTGMVEFLGSTPANIADFVLRRWQANPQAGKTLLISRHVSAAHTMRPWLVPLRWSVSKYPAAGSGGCDTDDAILRLLVQKNGVAGHFILQTFQKGKSYIMDPDQTFPKPSIDDFDSWVQASQFVATGIDLKFSVI
jgi:hypothetical protein